MWPNQLLKPFSRFKALWFSLPNSTISTHLVTELNYPSLTKMTKDQPQWVAPSSTIDAPQDYETLGKKIFLQNFKSKILILGTVFGIALQALSWLLIVLTFPFSMCVCLKVNLYKKKQK